jgi:hypothetical protein
MEGGSTMPVFISHRTADDAIARAVYDRLTKTHGILCYLDDLDRQTSSANITALIVNRVRQCTNLLALVTPNTQGSWWVPFEVGVAREAPRVITSFTNLAQPQLPEFLTEWPVLRGERAVDTFAEHYKKRSGQVKRAVTEGRTAAATAAGLAEVNEFHRQLKAALGQ